MLPYTAEVFHAFLAQYNAAIWPAPLVGVALGVAALALRPVAGAGRLVALILVAAWTWSGLVFHLGWFQTINFAAAGYGAVFLVQAALVAWLGLARDRLAPGALAPGRRGARVGVVGWAGAAMVAYALVGYPLVELLAGRGLAGAPLFAVAPGPTALATIGLVLLAARPPAMLLIVPVLWAVAEGATAWILVVPRDAALPVAAVVAVMLLLASRRTSG